MTVTTGSGDDYVRQLKPAKYLGSGDVGLSVRTTINTGAGQDAVDLNGCGGKTTINTGDGADEITIRSSESLLVCTVNAGAGDDLVDVSHTGTDGTWNIYTDHDPSDTAPNESVLVGVGNDSVTLSTLGDVASIETGPGSDSVTLLRLGATSTVVTGDDDDTVEIRSGEANTFLEVRTGTGADYIEVARTGSDAETTIETGSEADSIRVYGLQLKSNVTVKGDDPPSAPGDALVFVAGAVATQGSKETPNGNVYVPRQGVGQVAYAGIENLEVIALSDPDAGSYDPILEGSTLVLSAAASEIPSGRSVRYDWDLDGDGYYGDRTGVSRTLTWADLVGFGLGDDGQYTVSVRLTDVTDPSDPESNELIGQETFAFSTVTIRNVAPVVAGVAATPIFESGKTTLSGVIRDPGTLDTFTLQVNWGDGTDPESFYYPVGTVSFQQTHQYLDDGIHDIAVQVTDDDNESSPSSTFSLTVDNVPPTVEAGPHASANEGSKFTGSGFFTDPGADTWTATVDYGDGSGRQPLPLTDKNFTLSHLFSDNGLYTVAVTVTDDDTGMSSDTLTVTVGNVAPVVTSLSLNETTIDENGTVELSGSFSDLGAQDTHTVQINWGDGTSSPATVNPAARRFLASHPYLDDKPGGYPISVTVTDSDGSQCKASTRVLVTNLAPTVSADAATVTVVESETAENTGTFDDSGADTVTITASLGAVTQNDATWTWSYTPVDGPTDGPTDGQPVTITATDDDGGMVTTTFALVVQNAAPEVTALNLDKTTIDENGTVELSGSFSDLGVDDTHAVQIDWGDGKNSSATVDQEADTYSADHRYLDDGVYAINVKVKDDDHSQDTATTIIKVINVAPDPHIAGSNQGQEGSRVSLVAYATDPSPNDPIKLTWEVKRNGVLFCDGIGERIEFTPDDEGDYEVQLRASDEDGGSGETAMTVAVANRAPSVTADYGAVAVDEGQRAGNTGTFFDPGGDPVAITASVGAVVDNGDGTWSWIFDTTDGPGESQTVTITATDDAAAAASTTFKLIVENVAPTVVAGPAVTINEGSQLSRDGSFTDPGADIWTATVDYGDGSDEQLMLVDKTFTLNHVYADDGRYAVRVKVADNEGARSSSRFDVTVLNVAPELAGLILNETTIDESGTAELTGSFSDAGTGDTHTVQIDWGDGRSSAGVVDQEANTFSASHQYLDDKPGGYTMRVTLTDDDESSHVLSTSIVVANLAPTVEVDTATVTVDESSTATNTGTFDDLGDDAVTIAASIGMVTQNNVDKTWSWSYAPADGPSNGQSVTIRAEDGEGGVGTVTFDLVVDNVPPTVVAGPVVTIDEGSEFSGGGWFTDPGADTWTATVDYGDGSGEQPLPLGVEKTFALDYVYADNGVYTVTVTVTDDDEGSASATFTVHVDNIAPSASVDGPVEGNVDRPITVVVSASDPSPTDMESDFTYRIDWDGDSLVDQVVTGPAAGVDVDHTFPTADVYTIVVAAIDKDGDAGPPTEHVLTINDEGDCSIGGYVYLDVNNNGIKDAVELVLPNVPIMLTGDANRTVITDEHGWYEFTDLSPGEYHVVEMQPAAFIDGKDTPGEPLVGQCGNDMFYDLQLTSRTVARHYNFGELGLIPELISMKLFLASTPDGQAMLSTIVAETGEGWFTLAVPEEGEIVVRLNEQVENPHIELYTKQMMPVALSRNEHSMAAPVSQGENYVLHIAGDTGGGELRANLAITPPSPVTESADYVLDVNDDGRVSPLDALLVINELNDADRDTVVVIGSITYLLDVDGSGYLSPRDALLIINYLNNLDQAEGEQTRPVAVPKQAAVALPLQDMVPTALAEMGDLEWPGVQIPTGRPAEKSYCNDDLEDLLSTIADDVEEGWNDAQ